jgi:hypothetical protein
MHSVVHTYDGRCVCVRYDEFRMKMEEEMVNSRRRKLEAKRKTNWMKTHTRGYIFLSRRNGLVSFIAMILHLIVVLRIVMSI